MNKELAFRQLLESLQTFIDRGFFFHPEFLEEVKHILFKEAKGHEAAFFTLLIKQLSFVDSLGTRVDNADHNEILKHVTGGPWYSLHLKDSILNIRLLMTFSSQQSPLFLVCFFERGGKKRTDYTSYTKLLSKRYNELISEE